MGAPLPVALLTAVHPFVELPSERIEAIGRHLTRKAAAINTLHRPGSS
ncbi:hypothetical protein [Nocardia abscessus]|nr:hypothetical protein [Nocardia abscessus]